MTAPLVVGEWRNTPGASWPQQRAEVRRGGVLVGHLLRIRHVTTVQVRRADGTPVFNVLGMPKDTTGWIAAMSFPNVAAALTALEKSLG